MRGNLTVIKKTVEKEEATKAIYNTDRKPTSGGSRAQMSMALAGGNVPKAKTQLITQI